MPVMAQGDPLVTDSTIRQPEGSTRLAPLFRWPGGKRWLVPSLLKLVPTGHAGRYFEPFFGGGALFFALQPGVATLNDSNEELMACYRTIVEDPRAVEEALRGLRPDEGGYYKVRETRPTAPVDRAARFIFLTTHSFNGIYRVNRKGEFNVPYGYRSYSLGAHMSLEPYRRALQSAQLLSGDFSAAVATAKAGDFVYLDPPYTVTHSRNGFIKYNARVFLSKDQATLAATALRLHERGCVVAISNAEHESIQKLYAPFRPIPVTRFSTMASDPVSRKKVTEYVFTNAPEREGER